MEEESYKPRSIPIEGGDQVGKGDASDRLAAGLCEQGEDIVITSFPNYATPSGTAIRHILCSGYKEFESIPEVKDAIGTVEQTKYVMALFALNRLEHLSSLKRLAAEDKIILYDRSPYSNALTIAYNMAAGVVKNTDIDSLVNEALSLDSLFIDQLNLKNCVLHLHQENSTWVPLRNEKGDDKHETREVQDLCDDVFRRFGKIVGEGWHGVVTRKNDQWRDRKDIQNDILEFITSRMEIGRRGEKGSISYPTLDNYIGDLYPGVQIDPNRVVMWEDSIKENNKQVMYASGIEIGHAISESIKEINLQPYVAGGMKMILDKYPECYSILSYFFGDEYPLKLCKAVNEA